MDWQLAEAKNRLSEVVRRALAEGPQRIIHRDEAVMVIAESEYRRIIGERPSFISYLTTGPSFEDLPFQRHLTPVRDVDL